MLILALSEAAKTTIAYVVIWFVAFPALVTGLIGVALAQTYPRVDREPGEPAPPADLSQALPSSAAWASAIVKRRS